MRKFLFAIALLLTITAVLPCMANAANKTENEIAQLVKNKEKICDAKCVVYENACVVAIKTEKFLSKNEYDKFKEQLAAELCKKFNLSAIVVTRSPKAMHAISEIEKMSEKEREIAIEKFVDFELNRKPHNPRIQPR